MSYAHMKGSGAPFPPVMGQELRWRATMAKTGALHWRHLEVHEGHGIATRRQDSSDPVLLIVVGELGAADAERDLRRFAVKFYTEEGNWPWARNHRPCLSK